MIPPPLIGILDGQPNELEIASEGGLWLADGQVVKW